MNHYQFLDKHFKTFAEACGAETWCTDGVISAHGDKGYCYKSQWEEAGIPFYHGMMLYLLARLRPFCGTFEQPKVCEWVIENYPKFRAFMPIEELSDIFSGEKELE